MDEEWQVAWHDGWQTDVYRILALSMKNAAGAATAAQSTADVTDELMPPSHCLNIPHHLTNIGDPPWPWWHSKIHKRHINAMLKIVARNFLQDQRYALCRFSCLIVLLYEYCNNAFKLENCFDVINFTSFHLAIISHKIHILHHTALVLPRTRHWNDLPHAVNSPPQLAVFRRRLKTRLFSQSYRNWLAVGMYSGFAIIIICRCS